MNLYEIKDGLLNLKDIEFNRFQNWFEKFGYDRINKNAKSSKIRQSVLKLSENEFLLIYLAGMKLKPGNRITSALTQPGEPEDFRSGVVPPPADSSKSAGGGLHP